MPVKDDRELRRKNRAIKAAWVRLAACVFAQSPKRYMELVGEARGILHKEVKRDYDAKHPAKQKGRL